MLVFLVVIEKDLRHLEKLLDKTKLNKYAEQRGRDDRTSGGRWKMMFQVGKLGVIICI